MLIFWKETVAQDLPTSDVAAVLCVGSCEQHSDYLPMGTDSYLAEAVAREAAEKARRNVLLLPSLEVGFSPHHRHFPGCVTLRQETLAAYVRDVCLSAFRCGVQDILIINGHGGNQPALQTAVNEIGSEFGKSVVLVRYWDLVSEQVRQIRESTPGGMGHAGEFETSLMLWYHPELVTAERITPRPPAAGNEWHHPDLFSSNSVYRYVPFEAYSEQGNIGQPQYASREKGKQFAALVTDELARLIDTGLQSFRL